MNNSEIHPAESASSSLIETDAYEKWKIEMVMNNPQISILKILGLDMLLLGQLKLNVGILEIGSNQNQLEQLNKLFKLNVPVLLPSISDLNLEEVVLRIVESHSTQVHTQHDPYEILKMISDILEVAKANVGQVKFNQNLIKVQGLIQQYKEIFSVEHQLTQARSNINLAEHMDTLLQVRLRSTSDLLDVNLVKLNGNQNELMDMNKNLIRRISEFHCKPSMLQDNTNWEEMNSHAANIIQGNCGPKAKPYINKKDSFKDIWDQVAVMYTHMQTQPMEEQNQSTRQSGNRYVNYTWCESFYNDIVNGNEKEVESFLEKYPLASTTKITVDGNTALHIAVKKRKLKIVRKLLEKLEQENKQKETLKKQNKEGKTALYIAASCGYKTIAQELVNANNDSLLIESDNETMPLLPLFVAAKYNNKEIVKYLYDKMQNYKSVANELEKYPDNVEFSSREDSKTDEKKRWLRRWASFLANLIYNNDYDLATDIVNDYPNVVFTRYTDVETPLFALAHKLSPGANKTIHDKISDLQCIPFTGGTTLRASKLLGRIISKIDDLESQKSTLNFALFKAVQFGSVDFVTTIISSLPHAVSWLNDDHQNIFHVAIIHRQEKIFSIIHKLGPANNDLIGSPDKYNNWMLHLAGKVAPLNRLNEVPGAALQLQRELKWFEAVKEIAPNNSIDFENLDKQRPHELFVSEHTNLMKDAEQWIRSTASSCSIVATLIATVVFAAAFTVPGGYDQIKGYPLLLHQNAFLLFTISNGIALFSSCTSMLMFLAIFNSRFALQDYIKSLPQRLIFGIILLFISIVAMMSAFGVGLYILIQDRYHWSYIPIIVVGVGPIILFLMMHYRLLKDLWCNTYIPIFG